MSAHRWAFTSALKLSKGKCPGNTVLYSRDDESVSPPSSSLISCIINPDPCNPIGSFCSLYQRGPTTPGINQRLMAQSGYPPFRKPGGKFLFRELIDLIRSLLPQTAIILVRLSLVIKRHHCQPVYPRGFTRALVSPQSK